VAREYRRTYSEAGEDILLERLLVGALGIAQPTYLDIGTNEPIRGNNTYLFYRRGAAGICVEANPLLCERIRRRRPRDLCLNVGITPTSGQRFPFFVMDPDVLSTFSRHIVDRYVEMGAARLTGTVDVATMDINDVISLHAPSTPDLLSIDIEGLDGSVIHSLNFDRFRPKVICVETRQYGAGIVGGRDESLLSHLASAGYVEYADTHLNTILVDKSIDAAAGAESIE
jgi:FkbM family methyltransferase